jgi:hypothetical protein
MFGRKEEKVAGCSRKLHNDALRIYTPPHRVLAVAAVAYQRVTAVLLLLLIYGSLFLSGVCYCVSAHLDNTPAYAAPSVRVFLACKQITVLEHPPYSPDLALNDFFSGPKDKGIIDRKAF